MKKIRRYVKRITAAAVAAAMVVSLCACTDSGTDVADATLYGQIEEIGDGTITLLLGEMTSEEDSTDESADSEESGTESTDEAESETGDFSGEAPDGDFSGEAPDGDFSGDGDSFEAGDMEIPTNEDGEAETIEGGDFSGEAPDGDSFEGGDFSGEAGDMEIPTNEDGEAENTEGGGDFEGGDMPEGGSAGDAPSGDAGDGAAGSTESFTAGDETVTLEVSDDIADTLSSFSVGDVVMVVTDSDGVVTSITSANTFSGDAQMASGDMGGGDMGGGDMNSSSDVDQGSYANLIDEDGTYSDTTYTSTGDDENALRIDGATVTLENITADKSDGSSSDVENGDFYGVNAAILATNGAQVTITGATITSSAQNGNGVFSYGSGTVVNISDSTITTTADNSGGIQTTGGGTTNAYNLTVETSGSSSAAIRSDRGGGTVNVSGGTYTSNGYNSPAVYSTASITVSDATLTANNSEALVVEGQNSITLTDCDVYGNMSDEYGTSSAINVHNIMIYQSTSGDAEEGTSYFSATGGSITSNNGDMFYITNTACVITLSGVEFINNETDGNFMTIAGNDASNGWGSAGSNGAQVELACVGQEIEGDITVDTISTLDISLTEGSVLTGTINIVDNEEGGTAVSDNVVVTIDEDSVWNLTGDCTITSIINNGTINYNGYTITLADGTVLSD